MVRTAALFVGLAIVLFLLSLFSSPRLPDLGLPEVAHLAHFTEVPGVIRGEKVSRNLPFRMRKAAHDIKYVRSLSPVLHPKQAARTAPERPIVFGYYVNWDPASIVSLRLNLQHLTHLVPEWLVLENGKGDLSDETDPVVVQIAADSNLPILAMLTNFRDGWQAGDLHQTIETAEARANLIDNIYSNLVEHKFAGVNVDLEELGARDRDRMVAFMEALSKKLKPAGLLLTESVPTDDEAYDVRRLAAVCDYIVPMVYDEHYQSGAPGPVASQEWFEKQLLKLRNELPLQKTVIGVGGYGYDWVIGGRGAAEVIFGDVMSAARANRASVEWDVDTGNPVLRYTEDGQRHEVWYLDAVTALNQVRATEDAGFRGCALWRLGGEDPGFWNVLKPEMWPEENYDPSQLGRLSAQKSALEYGDGDVLRIAETPRDGMRTAWLTAEGGYAERYQVYPSYYVVEHTGKPGSNLIALSFDDGPDPEYTPRILDILKAHKLSAAFFVVGVNAEQYPDLIRREYNEGHEIGNHTYSHPNIAETSPERTRLELTATERILEHTIGVATTLFRPPYNADSEPQTPEEIIPIVRAQDAGYVTVAERIDPRDWEKGKTPDSILEEVAAEKETGGIVLLHDGGGDRSATIAALPRIIDYFQQNGYRIVSLGELIGKTRAEIMPVPSKDEQRWAQIEGQAFGTKSTIKQTIGIMFLWAIFITLARSGVFGTLAIIEKLTARRRRFDVSFRPPVSVVIAAFNEDKVICGTVKSVLANGYPDLEVIIVDDGSKDRTLEVLQAAFGSDPRVHVFAQGNAGKAAALNYAISNASHEVLVALDADTILRAGTVEKLARHFADPRVGAVSGNARVGNRRNWITRFQSIEYIYGFNLDRRALDLLNAITVVPGAAGAWRKSLIQAVGGFRNDTLAEDTDLTLAIRRLGYRVRYEEQAVAFTEAPEDARSLARQRFRWAFGTLQSVWKHRDATFAPEYGTLGFVALPSVWTFQILLSVLAPFADLAMLIALIAGNWEVVLAYYCAFFVVELLTGLLAYGLEGEKPTDLLLLFFQRIFYRLLMQYVLAKSLLYALRGGVVGWGKIERKATVTGA